MTLRPEKETAQTKGASKHAQAQTPLDFPLHSKSRQQNLKHRHFAYFTKEPPQKMHVKQMPPMHSFSRRSVIF